MAKFRMNHARQGKGASGNVVRVGIFAALISGLFLAYEFFTGGSADPADRWSDEKVTPADTVDDRAYYLPQSFQGVLIHHTYFSLSYVEADEQPEWVAYTLTRDRLKRTSEAERLSDFSEDKDIPTGSANDLDYRNSGYDRGHLAPAADMGFHPVALKESFLYSNISPQANDFNTGIWRELEANVRAWANRNKKLYVVTGPVLSQPGKGTIGQNRVTIPSAFYKVVLDLSEPGKKGIAFLIPHSITFDPLPEFATSIDEVESLTGIDFFPELMPDELESELESSVNLDLWPFSQLEHNRRTNR